MSYLHEAIELAEQEGLLASPFEVTVPNLPDRLGWNESISSTKLTASIAAFRDGAVGLCMIGKDLRTNGLVGIGWQELGQQNTKRPGISNLRFVLQNAPPVEVQSLWIYGPINLGDVSGKIRLWLPERVWPPNLLDTPGAHIGLYMSIGKNLDRLSKQKWLEYYYQNKRSMPLVCQSIFRASFKIQHSYAAT